MNLRRCWYSKLVAMLAAVMLLFAAVVPSALAAGTITEFPVPNSAPLAITSGPDGALWFTGSNPPAVDLIGRITTDGTVTEFPLPTISNLNSITAGPDGALWFTEQTFNGNDQIGRITTDGIVTEFPLPTPNGGPEGITAGPDGALWFTEHQRDQIGRIPTDPP